MKRPSPDNNNTEQLARAEETAARVAAARRPAQQPQNNESERTTGISGNEKAKASLEGMLRRVSGREKAQNTEKGADVPGRRRVAGARLRTRAEQELFDALKTGGDKA